MTNTGDRKEDVHIDGPLIAVCPLVAVPPPTSITKKSVVKKMQPKTVSIIAYSFCSPGNKIR